MWGGVPFRNQVWHLKVCSSCWSTSTRRTFEPPQNDFICLFLGILLTSMSELILLPNHNLKSLPEPRCWMMLVRSHQVDFFRHSYVYIIFHPTCWWSVTCMHYIFASPLHLSLCTCFRRAEDAKKTGILFVRTWLHSATSGQKEYF